MLRWIKNLWIRLTCDEHWFVDIEEKEVYYKSREEAAKAAIANKSDLFVCWHSQDYGYVYQTDAYWQDLGKKK